MKQASFVLSIVAVTLSVISVLAVAWLYIEKKVRYICKDSAWRKASYIEMDTYKWEKGKDGEMKKVDYAGV